ncbi:right-handed parallel beta-helix repeat-containing protein [bacterium]|nr:right-handed parallel beta-helix repeat-containing protein [bacterium]
MCHSTWMRAVLLIASVFLLGACNTIQPRQTAPPEAFAPVTLYVNAESGNDCNSGLKPSAAKKTIQAAVNMVPSRLHSDFTIRVAPGVYRESVEFIGISAPLKHRLVVLGDDDVLPSETISPKVRLTGADDDSSHEKKRDRGFVFTGCNNIEVKGFLIDYFKEFPVYTRQSLMTMNRCKASYSDTGYFADNSMMALEHSWASFNKNGVIGYTQAQIYLSDCGIADNEVYGVLAQASCVVNMINENQISRNQQGIGMENSYLWFQAGNTTFTGNTVTGIALRYMSVSRGMPNHTFFRDNAHDTSIDEDSLAR